MIRGKTRKRIRNNKVWSKENGNVWKKDKREKK